MDKNELRTVLEGHLDTLKRNLAVVSLEELKTKYRKPFEELQHNISATATAYVKQAGEPAHPLGLPGRGPFHHPGLHRPVRPAAPDLRSRFPEAGHGRG